MSIVTPNTLCDSTCSIFLSFNLRSRIRGLSWCFCLVVITIDFVLSGLSIILFLLHQLSILSRPSWRLVLTTSSCLSWVCRELSSAKISQVTFRPFKHNGRSLIYRQKSKGPRIDPCGTPDVMDCWDDETPLFCTNCVLLLMYEFRRLFVFVSLK